MSIRPPEPGDDDEPEFCVATELRDDDEPYVLNPPGPDGKGSWMLGSFLITGRDIRIERFDDSAVWADYLNQWPTTKEES